MNQIALIGYGALIAAFLVNSGTLISAIIASLSGARRYRLISEYGIYIVCALYGVAATAMIHAFIDQDTSLVYVYKYSESAMPWYYQLTAFWGGQAGSLMFWAALLSIASAAAVFFHRERDRVLMPTFIGVLSFIQLFFALLLVLEANPFEVFDLINPPPEGAGLNPQLQTFTMIIHPPSLLSGYVVATIPFAFAMSALLSGRLDDQWLKSTRKWTLISWLFLATGLLLGMLWAYTELGWGGYWAWDPVENAALVPWLIMTAFLHSAVIQERRGMLKRWNMFLVITAWLTTILGTYITRSGLIVSVHTFAQSGIGPFFEYFLYLVTLLSLAAFIWRWDALKADRSIQSPLSREAVFLANNWILLSAAFVVLWGTLFPRIKEMFTGNPSPFGEEQVFLNNYMAWIAVAGGLFCITGAAVAWQRSRPLRSGLLGAGVMITGYGLYLGSNKVFDGLPVELGPPWFNQWMAPLGIIALALIGVGTMISWRKASKKNFQRNFVNPLIAAGVSTVIFALLYYFLRLRQLGTTLTAENVGFSLVTLYFCGFVTFATLQEFWRGTRSRMSKLGLGVIAALTGLVMRNQRRYGGYIVHLGLVLIFFGFMGKLFTVEAKIGMTQGQVAPLGDYEVRFNGFTEAVDPEKKMIFANIDLMRDGVVVSQLTPGKYIYNSHPRSPTTEVDLRSTPLEDIYFHMANYEIKENGGGNVVLMMVINPFVFWIWAGGVLLIFGTFIALWPQTEPLRAPKGSRARAAASLLLWCTLIPALTLWSTDAFASSEHDHAHEGGNGAVQIEVLSHEKRELLGLVRCGCEGCGGQAIDSCHPGCGDGLRDQAQIERMLNKGMSREEILSVFVKQRGEGALMKPPERGFNRLAWILPLAMLVVSVPIIGLVITHKQRTQSLKMKAEEEAQDLITEDEMSEDELARLDFLEQELEELD